MSTLIGALKRHVTRFDGDAPKLTDNDPRIAAREALSRQLGEVTPVVPRQMTTAPAVTSQPDASPTSPYGALLAFSGRR